MTAAAFPDAPTWAPVRRWAVVVDDAPVAVAVRPLAGVAAMSVPSIAVAGAAGVLSLRADDGCEVARVDVPDGLLTLAWSPDGSVLSAGGPGGAYRWTHAGGSERLPVSGWCASLAWSASGRLALADGRSAVVIDGTVARPSPGVLWRTPDVASTVTSLRWLRDGRELALAAYGGVLAFTRGRSGPVRELSYAGSLLTADASPDGRWLVSGNQDASLHVWRVRDGAEFEMAGFPRKVTRVAFDRTGRWLAADGSPDITVWDLSGKGPEGTSPRLLSAHPDGATAIAWHPDRPMLATGGADGGLAVWDVPRCAVGRATPPLWSTGSDPGTGRGISALAWLPDGSSLIVATAAGTLIAVEFPGPDSVAAPAPACAEESRR